MSGDTPKYSRQPPKQSPQSTFQEILILKLEKLIEEVSWFRKEKERKDSESQVWGRKQNLNLVGPQTCIFCNKQNVRMIARGLVFYGCVVCIRDFLESSS
jgi:hypothetical protein